MAVRGAATSAGIMTGHGQRIAVRTDASLKIGTGHVVRCLTLAEALRSRGARVAFICREHSGNLNQTIRHRGFALRELPGGEDETGTGAGGSSGSAEGYLDWLGTSRERDAEACVEALGADHPDWLVVDHYALDRSWAERLRPRVGNIMVIDDLANRPHECDVLLDQNLSREGAARYDGLTPRHCTRLIGPDYALLRGEFAQARGHLQSRDGTVTRVLISFGGVDAHNIAGRVLEALRAPDLAALSIDVVVGASDSIGEAQRRELASDPRVRIHSRVDNMAELMSGADLAIGAGGTSTWERLALGLPTLVITVAKNQEAAVEVLHEKGYVEWLGTEADVKTGDIAEAVRRAARDPAANRAQCAKGMALVTCRGADTVASMLLSGIPPERWSVREARPADCVLYWEWANDPDVRRNAFHPDPVTWQGHERWFHDRLRDDDTTLLVVEAEQGPVGQVRFDRDGDRYVVSYSLSRQFRGLGLGRALLAKGIKRFLGASTATLVGETVSHNEASARIFERLGFVEVAPERAGSRRFELACSARSLVRQMRCAP